MDRSVRVETGMARCFVLDTAVSTSVLCCVAILGVVFGVVVPVVIVHKVGRIQERVMEWKAAGGHLVVLAVVLHGQVLVVAVVAVVVVAAVVAAAVLVEHAMAAVIRQTARECRYTGNGHPAGTTTTTAGWNGCGTPARNHTGTGKATQATTEEFQGHTTYSTK